MSTEPLHDHEETRYISNLFHRVEGLLIGSVALVALAQAFVPVLAALSLLRPMLVLIAGVSLPLVVLLHRGFLSAATVWRAIAREAQQRQHLYMALLLVVAGSSEVLHSVKSVHQNAWLYAGPLALVSMGVVFVVHHQHGTSEAVAKAVTMHRWIAMSLSVAGALRIADLATEGTTLLRAAWPIALLAAAGLLIRYEEPAGAFRTEGLTTHYMHLS